MAVLVTCKCRKYSKSKSLSAGQHFFIISLWDNFSSLKGKQLQSKWSALVRNRTRPLFYGFRSKLKSLCSEQHFPRYKTIIWNKLPRLPWKPEFLSNLRKNLMQPFPCPGNASHKIWSRLANFLRDIQVWKCGRTTDYGRRTTDDGRAADNLFYKLNLWAFGSGVPKNCLLSCTDQAR